MADLDLSSPDPRQYNLHKIVRDVLGEDIDAIREDPAYPFRSVGSAAKETSSDATQAANDVVKKGRAMSLSKQIEAKRDKRLAEKDVEKTESDGGTEGSENSKGTEGVEDAENPQSVEQQATTAPSRGVLQQTDGAEDEFTSEQIGSAEPVESIDGADETKPEKTESEQSEEAEGTEGVERPERPDCPAELELVEVLTSLVEPQTATSDGDTGGATTVGDSFRVCVHPLSPRDIVHAANTAARTHARAARITVDFRPIRVPSHRVGRKNRRAM